MPKVRLPPVPALIRRQGAMVCVCGAVIQVSRIHYCKGPVPVWQPSAQHHAARHPHHGLASSLSPRIHARLSYIRGLWMSPLLFQVRLELAITKGDRVIIAMKHPHNPPVLRLDHGGVLFPRSPGPVLAFQKLDLDVPRCIISDAGKAIKPAHRFLLLHLREVKVEPDLISWLRRPRTAACVRHGCFLCLALHAYITPMERPLHLWQLR
mmetsp:Transcript_52594/g.76836  ORF Transcript_52594/g.76836 Transcript_52594/m.76836 type:complete len:209 (+) Transcript_52594:435-1061(+)